MSFPKLLFVDLDGIIRVNSRNPSSRLYRILRPEDMVFKPNVVTAFHLIFAQNVEVAIVTKQRALADGTLSAEVFGQMRALLRSKLLPPLFYDADFPSIFVETKNENKKDAFQFACEAFPKIAKEDIVVIDDSEEECKVAEELGMRTVKTTDLYATVCELFDLTP